MRECVREYVYAAVRYVKAVKWAIVAIGVIAFVAHGALLFSDCFGIDTDFIIEGEHNFDVIGRPGLIWLGKLLGLSWFNLYYAQVMTFLFMVLIPIAFGFLFYVTGKQRNCLNSTLLVFGLSFLVSPFWTAQIYFLNQSVQVTCSCVLITLAILLVELSRKEQKWLKWGCLLSAVLVMLLVFACYQVLIMIYIMAVAAVFLFVNLQEKMTVKQQLGWIFYHIVVFLVGFSAYMTVSKLFFLESSMYLQNQIKWNGMSLAEGLQNCMDAIGNTLQDNPPYYTGMYGVFAVLLVLVTLYWLGTESGFGKANGFFFVLVELFVIASSYAFILLYGGEILDRMQLVMPLSQGCMLYLTIILLYRIKPQAGLKRLLYYATYLVLTVAIYNNTITQLNFTNRFYYSENWRFEYDKNIARDVYEDVNCILVTEDLADRDFDNILFLGCPYYPYNRMGITGDAMGRSFFDFNINSVERPRITYFMREIGYPIEVHFTGGELAAFYCYFEDCFAEQVEGMPVYPEAGYVQYLSNSEMGLEYIVVKLGDNWKAWKEE